MHGVTLLGLQQDIFSFNFETRNAIQNTHTHIMCGQNVEIVKVKIGGACSDHCAVHRVTTGL